MKRLRPLVLALVLALLQARASAQGAAFGSLDALLAYADAHSAVSRSADAQTDLARLQNAAAYANLVNLRGTASLSLTDNFKLPVNFLPAEIFGGPSGTFRAVTFGQEFVNLASVAPQLDVVNPGTWARVGSAKASAALTATSNAVSRRNLHEGIATAYYNHCAAAAQLQVAQEIVRSADSIVETVRRRHAEGLVRAQDLHNAEANRISLDDFASQIQLRMDQAALQLRALLGLPAETPLTLTPPATASQDHAPNALAGSQLLRRQASLQADVQRHELLAARLGFLPTISLVAGFNWQQNSNEGMFNDAEWIASRYVGLRLSMPLPTETRIWSQAEESRINLRMREINADQAALQEDVQNAQLRLEADRAYTALVNAERIAALKTQNYGSAMQLYGEGLSPIDQLLTAFTDLLNAQLTVENARWNLQLQLTRNQLFQQ